MIGTRRGVGHRRAMSVQRGRNPKAQPVSVPAPVGGWNTRDALDAMPPTDAVVLDNWFPTTGKVTVRKGYEEFVSSGMGTGNVDTLAELRAGTVSKFVACSNGNIYDITSGTPASLGSGFTDDQWQWASFKGRLFFVNGSDAPQDYDGTTLSATGWTGPTATDLIGVNVFKSRLYFIERDSQSFWYAAPSGVTGALTEFDLSTIGRFGGNLTAMLTWTHDGGDGVDDHAVFVMSSGEVIVYQGSDPGSAADWALTGVYRIGTPLGIRGVAKLGGDLIIMTKDDFVSLTEVLRTGQVGNPSKLSGAVRLASANAGLFGWQALLYKQGEQMIFNIPEGATYTQFVVNTTTGAPCRFTGMNSRCWGLYDSDLYFGGTDGKVYKADTGENDNGSPIDADGQAAWGSLGPVSVRVTAIRPIIQSEGDVNFGVALGLDFNSPALPAPSSTPAATASLWDVAEWDVAEWASELQVSTVWKAAKGHGQAVSPRLKLQALQEISWIRTDYRIEQGMTL